MNLQSPKRRAALEALNYLPNEGVIGLGTGSTATFFIEGVAEAIRSGRHLECVATSEQSRRQALDIGIPLLDNAGPWDIDLCVDGADEVSQELDLIKGGGGCHLREKIVNQSSRFNIIIVDESKLSAKLGQLAEVPVEVVTFGHAATRRLLQRFGKASLRLDGAEPWRTDGGNLIYDVAVGPIADPAGLDLEFHKVPGVVETGLFVGRTDLLIIGSESGTRCVQKRRSFDPAQP